MSRINMVPRSWHAAALLALLGATACGPGFAPAGVDVVVRRPPPERVEVIGTAPGAGYVWVRGRYAWQGGDYVWMAGSWQAPPSSGRHWQAGRWARTRGGWYWQEGHWR